MRLYQLTDVGEAEASAPVSEPSDARQVLYYLRKRSNGTASDDMIAAVVFGGDKSRTQIAIRKCIQSGAIKSLG